MKLTKAQLHMLIESYLLREDVADSVAKQTGLLDQQRIEMIRTASNKPHRLQKPELLWIAKYFLSAEGSRSIEPIEDIVAKIKDFKHSRSRIAAMGKSTNLSDYETPGDLTKISSRAGGYLDLSEVAKESELIYDGPDWAVYMPFTREASCTLGSGTSWCTALRLKGNNLFYNYVIRSGVILYYVLYKGNKALEDKYKKIALGFINGKVDFPNKFGGITVNADNAGISRQEFIGAIDKVAPALIGTKIISLIERHGNALAGKHPAKSKVLKILESPASLNRELRGKSSDVKIDFIKSALEYAESERADVPENVLAEMHKHVFIKIKDLEKALMTPVVADGNIIPLNPGEKNELAMFDLYDQVQSLNDEFEIGDMEAGAEKFLQSHVEAGFEKQLQKSFEQWSSWGGPRRYPDEKYFGTLEQFYDDFFDIDYLADDGSTLFKIFRRKFDDMSLEEEVDALTVAVTDVFYENGLWFFDTSSHGNTEEATYINLHNSPEFFTIALCPECKEDAAKGVYPEGRKVRRISPEVSQES